MRINRLLSLAIFFLILFSTAVLCAAQGEIALKIDRDEIPLSGSIRLDLTFYGVKDMPPPQLPAIEGFKPTHLRSSDAVSRIDGGIVHSTRHTYVLMPERSGAFNIGPFDILYDGQRYLSKEVGVTVLGGAAERLPKEPGLTAQERINAREQAFLLIETEKDEVYVNEILHVGMGLYYRDMMLTDIRRPSLEHEGFSIGEFIAPVKSKKTIKGNTYNLVTFRSSVFATRPGDLKLGPAVLNSNRMDISKAPSSKGSAASGAGAAKYGTSNILRDIHQKYKKRPFRIESEAKDITALPLPADARPAGFNGAVGDFRFTLKLDPSGYVKTGQPLTLVMEISGKGNMDIVSPPAIGEGKDYILYEPILKEQTDSYKIFEQVLIPKTTAFKQVPAIAFSFFDPAKDAYRTISKGPLSVKVIEAHEAKEAEIQEKVEAAKTLPKKEAIGRDIIYIKDAPGKFRKTGTYLYTNKLFIFSQGLPVLIYLSILVFYRRRQRLRNDMSYARRRYAYKKALKGLRRCSSLSDQNKTEEFFNLLFTVIQEYFGDKFNLPPGGITMNLVDEVLKPKGFKESVLNKVRNFFRAYDMARFTPSEYSEKDRTRLFKEAKEIINIFRRA